MEIYTFSAKGRRENNEDYLLNRQLLSGYSIHLLADGMGGHEHGEIASLLACEAIAGYLAPNLANSDIVSTLQQSVSTANSIMYDKSQQLGAKMGTTIAGTLIQGNKAYIFWLGDVRIYHFRNNQLLFQSEDHSLINDMQKQGSVSALNLERYKNIVTRSITGTPEHDELVVTETNCNSGDTLLLCSDGLWQNWDIASIFNLSEEKLDEIFSEKESSNEDNYSMLRIQF